MLTRVFDITAGIVRDWLLPFGDGTAATQIVSIIQEILEDILALPVHHGLSEA